MTEIEYPPLFAHDDTLFPGDGKKGVQNLHTPGDEDRVSAAMDTRQSVSARKVNRHSGAIRGDDNAIVDALIATAVTFRWSRRDHAYVVPMRRFDDVLATLEAAGHRVSFKAGLW